jgi:mRNA interferase MazF
VGMVKRGEVWLTRLDPTVGSEFNKTRPCLVVSPDGQDHLRTVMIVPFTTKGRSAPYRTPVLFAGRTGLILTDQTKSVDKRRLLKLLGVLDAATLSATLAILRDTFEE